MKKIMFVAAIGFFLAGCHQQVKNYPSHPTAVVEAYVHNFGFKGLFASEGNQTTDTRADRRRMESHFKMTGAIMKHLVKPRVSAEIWRVDKNLLWNLNLPKRTYVECPLLGCAVPAMRQTRNQKKNQKPACELTLEKNHFSVKSTGETRTIHGFNTREYEIAWDIIAQDKAKNKDNSALTIDLWTTPENDPRVAAVLGVQRNFEKALRPDGLEGSDLGRFVPNQAFAVLSDKFLSGLSPKEQKAVARASRELRKISGYPISTRLEWRLDAKACQSPKPKEAPQSSPGLDFTHGVGGFLSSAGGWAAHKEKEKTKKEMKGKPTFGFVKEIQSMQVEPASDALFFPPENFKLVDRR